MVLEKSIYIYSSIELTMKRQIKKLLLLTFLLTAGWGNFQAVRSQPTTDPCDTANPDEPCPIDGGLSILLAAGAFYGIRKHRFRREDSRPEERNSVK
jgi:hypothetical protein